MLSLAYSDGDDAVFQLQVIQMIIRSSEGCGKNGRPEFQDHNVLLTARPVPVNTKSAENFTQINLANRIFFSWSVGLGRYVFFLFLWVFAFQSGFRIGRWRTEHLIGLSKARIISHTKLHGQRGKAYRHFHTEIHFVSFPICFALTYAAAINFTMKLAYSRAFFAIIF